MNVAYGFAFLVLSVLAGLSAAMVWADLGWPALGIGYFAASLLLLSVAYCGVGPRVFLKRESGRISLAGWLLFAPYFLLNFAIFRFYRTFSREPGCVRLTPNLYFGRRLASGEARGALPRDLVAVLDLAAEFSEIAGLRSVPGYRSLPVLDATAPTAEQLREAVEYLTKAASTGPVYVHCAMGHGRTVCVVVAYLLTAGVVRTVAEGVRLMRASRPGVRLNRAQREALRPHERAALPSGTATTDS